MKLNNRTKFNIQFESKGKVIYFGKEIDKNKIPVIAYYVKSYKFNLEDKVVLMKLNKPKIIQNIPEKKKGTYYIVDEKVAELLKRNDLISPLVYKKVGDVLYCKSFKIFEEVK